MTLTLNKQRSTTRAFIAEHIVTAHKEAKDASSRDGCMICEAWFWLIEAYHLDTDSASALLDKERSNPLKGKQDV